jgi:hypothetical protein
MVFVLNCKPFSPAHTDRKKGSNCIPYHTEHGPHLRKIYCYNPAESNPAKSLLNHAQTTTKKY